MQLTDLVGWLATAVLIATLSRQIYKQHQSPDPAAVSSWLFLGQITASCLFITYSALVDSRVFVVTNSLVLLTAVTGQYLAWRKRRHARSATAEIPPRRDHRDLREPAAPETPGYRRDREDPASGPRHGVPEQILPASDPAAPFVPAKAPD